MKTTMKKLLAMLLALTMLFAVAACGKTEQPEEPTGDDPVVNELEPEYGGVFHLAKTTAPSSLFPIYKAVNGGGYLNPALETLGYQDPVTAEVMPRLLESYTFDETTGNITAKLREGIKFHDGSELTAEVVKWNYDFMKENGQASSVYNVEVTVTGDYTFDMTFDKFRLDAPTVLVKSICSKQAYDEFGLDYCIANPVGTGPFKFVEYVPDLKIVYEKNENYWQEGRPYLDGYVVDILASETATTAFINGDVHAMEQANVAQCKMIEAEGYQSVGLPVYGGYSVYGFAPNTKVADDPWAKLEVRQAVMLYGLNYAELAALGGGPLANVAHTFDIEGGLCYNETIDANYVYDEAKAKQMLADAGYPNGFETTIYAQTVFKGFATALQASLEKLGIKANVELIQSNDPRRSDGATPGLFVSLQNSAWDVMTKPMASIYNQRGTTQGKNILFSDEYQKLFGRANSATTYEERGALAKELMQKFFIDDCLYAVAYNRMANRYVRNEAHGTGMEYNLPSPYQTWLEQPKA